MNKKIDFFEIHTILRRKVWAYPLTQESFTVQFTSIEPKISDLGGKWDKRSFS